MGVLGKVEDVYLKRRMPRKDFILNTGFSYILPIKFTNTSLPPLPPIYFPFTLPIDFEEI